MSHNDGRRGVTHQIEKTASFARRHGAFGDVISRRCLVPAQRLGADVPAPPLADGRRRSTARVFESTLQSLGLLEPLRVLVHSGAVNKVQGHPTQLGPEVPSARCRIWTSARWWPHTTNRVELFSQELLRHGFHHRLFSPACMTAPARRKMARTRRHTGSSPIGAGSLSAFDALYDDWPAA